jgi:hypothetical protein
LEIKALAEGIGPFAEKAPTGFKPFALFVRQKNVSRRQNEQQTKSQTIKKRML